jgi:hypothetical protein
MHGNSERSDKERVGRHPGRDIGALRNHLSHAPKGRATSNHDNRRHIPALDMAQDDACHFLHGRPEQRKQTGLLLGPDLERRLGRELSSAASAYPPGVPQAEVRAIANVVEAAGLRCSGLVDEPSAAASGNPDPGSRRAQRIGWLG